ncbi:MAG: hypothetical protein DIU60_000460 [Actinomycetes bacterium]|jgi:hypothetical protein|nr:MAG: hypothetical protein DIU60_16665 [Actinomycetota bacterium]
MRVIVTDAEVTMADVLALRMTVDKPLTDGAELVLRHRGTGLERRVELDGARQDAGSAEVAVALPRLALTPGRWDAYLQQDGPRTRMPSIDPGFSLDRLDEYALRRRELAYRAYRTQTGYLALKIDEARPVADVRAVWFREGRFEATGLLAYTGFADDDERRRAHLELRHPEDAEVSVTALATVRGVRFHVALSLCDVIAAAPDFEGLWEPLLFVDGLDEPLPLAARIDDVDGRRRRVHYPATTVDGVRIRPCYTTDDELRLEVGG